ncbi:MAG TPA: hypothetical protein VGD58_19235 [Herpetosiphonaceae bacterium]
MITHRVETVLKQDGTLTLENLPFHAGETVEIIIHAQPDPEDRSEQYSLRGLPLRYDRPTETVALDDWGAAGT